MYKLRDYFLGRRLLHKMLTQNALNFDMLAIHMWPQNRNGVDGVVGDLDVVADGVVEPVVSVVVEEAVGLLVPVIDRIVDDGLLEAKGRAAIDEWRSEDTWQLMPRDLRWVQSSLGMDWWGVLQMWASELDSAASGK